MCAYLIRFSFKSTKSLTSYLIVEKSFVLGVRALEFTLGIICDKTFASGILTDDIALSAFKSAIPIIAKLSKKYHIGPLDSFKSDGIIGSSGNLSGGWFKHFLGSGGRQRQCLATQ